MSRREYDFENGDTSLDALMKAINEQKANFGGDSMYIELARKFDNSDYQWVIYRSTKDSDNYGGDTTTGYFVLFRKSGTVEKSIAFSYKYLGHGAAQTFVEQTSTSSPATQYWHFYLFVYTGSTVRSNVLQTYGVDFRLVNSTVGWIIQKKSDVALKCTSGNIYNWVTQNVYVYKSGTTIEWHGNSNSARQCSVVVSFTLSSSYAYDLTITASVARTESTSQRIGCQLLYYYLFYRWITWDPDSPTTTISYTTNTSKTGWNRSTTTFSPFVNTYNNVYYLPIWSWNPQGYTPDVNYFNKSLWWCISGGPAERKYIFSSMQPITVDSSAANIDYYRIDNSVNLISFGGLTVDGRTIYTMNANTKLLEKIDTKVR